MMTVATSDPELRRARHNAAERYAGRKRSCNEVVTLRLTKGRCWLSRVSAMPRSRAGSDAARMRLQTLLWDVTRQSQREASGAALLFRAHAEATAAESQHIGRAR